MKNFFGTLVLSLAMVSSTFAATGSVRYQCTNGEETKVDLREVSTGVFQADVTVQSVGDSYPTYHFKNVQSETGLQDVARGVPETFRGKGIELTIAVDALDKPATLDAPSIGLKNEKLNCK